MKNLWKPLSESVVFEDGILRIRHKDYFYEKAADSMTFTILDISDWALIIPKTPDNHFIVVRQFRIGFEEDTLEFPGGSINKNEEYIHGAERELMEETGAVSDKLIPIGILKPNPAFMTNRCHIFMAENCKIELEPKPDKFEDTEALIVTEKELRTMIKKGEFSQSLSIAAFGLYLNILTDK